MNNKTLIECMAAEIKYLRAELKECKDEKNAMFQRLISAERNLCYYGLPDVPVKSSKARIISLVEKRIR